MAEGTKRSIPIVLVGLGRMGKNHLRILRETPGFNLVGVVEPSLAGQTVGGHGGEVPAFGHASELARAKIEFEAAVVATPTATHFKVVDELIAMKKHLLVEKPIASTYDQARTLIDRARSNGVKLAVGHVERFNPAVRKLREVIREGWLGTPIHFSFTRVGGYPERVITGNNVLLDLAVHDIDVLRSLVGPVKLEHSICHSAWREGVFDTAEILLAAPSGPTATVHVNWITPTKIRSIRVTGTRGVCFVDYILQTCELHGGNLVKTQLKEPPSVSFEVLQEMYRSTDKIQFGVQKIEPLRVQAEQFHGYLSGRDAGELCTAKDALAAVMLAERAVQVERGRTKSPSVPPSEILPTPKDDWI